MSRKEIFGWFFIAIFLYLFYLFFQLIKPYLIPLFWAAILALVLYPVHEKLTRLMKNRAGLSSVLMTFLTVALVIVPIFMLITSLSIEMFDVYNSAKSKGDIEKLANFITSSLNMQTLEKIIPSSIFSQLESRFDLGELNFKSVLLKGSKEVSGHMVNLFKGFATNVTSMLFNFAIMVFSLFFFFRDGRTMYEKFKYLIPMEEDQKNRTFTVFYNTIDGVVLGSLATAAIQGILVMFIFLVLDLSYPFLAGSLSFILSLLPLVGAAFVWVPASIYLLITHAYLKGIILILFGVLVISMSDNILRPIIIGGKVKLPTFILFLSIMGGLSYFGFSGVVLGPVLLALFISFIEIYKQEYRDKKPN
jgi:predicted PurR-regulated permease PerM